MDIETSAAHAGQIMAADFFVVPTVTFRLLFVLIVLGTGVRDLSRRSSLNA